MEGVLSCIKVISVVRVAENKRFRHRMSVYLLVQKFLDQENSVQRNT